MNETIGKLTVYFEDPFWIGVFERMEVGKLSVCKVTFGAELKQSADNPKRRQRNVKKQLQNTGIGTKSQQALAAQREKMKIERKQTGKEQREAEKQRQFDLKQQKRKEKHRGR